MPSRSSVVQRFDERIGHLGELRVAEVGRGWEAEATAGQLSGYPAPSQDRGPKVGLLKVEGRPHRAGLDALRGQRNADPVAIASRR